MTLEVEALAESYRAPEVFYPDSDGEPMADNTLQLEWIFTLKGGLDFLFKDDPDVFVAGDLLWYPVQGDNRTSVAPDVMVVFGRPKGYRGSYQQWEEAGIAPQVVFEVLSPSNTLAEMASKRQSYSRYGVEEYYEYDPNHGTLHGWQRIGVELIEIDRMQGWVSPRLGVTFGLEGTDLVLTGPDGRRLQSYIDVATERDNVLRERNEAISRLSDAFAERNEISAELDQERERRESAEQMAERLAARLRELGIEP